MEKSEYELLREAKMARNKAQLDALGLKQSAPQRARRPKRRSRPDGPAEHTQPRRTSARVAAAADPPRDTAPQLQSVGRAPDSRAEAFLEACEAEGPDGAATLTFGRHHQHLTRSRSGRSVMTTGCAGYGAALGAKCVVGAATVRYGVRAARFGVGGFGVGLVRAHMPRPYRSIVGSAACVAVYLSSGRVRRGGGGDGDATFGPTFKPGDVIAVILRRSSETESAFDVAFEVNGEEVCVFQTGLKARDTISLAVQPYMGGVAVLV